MASFSKLYITNKGKELLGKDIYATPDSIIFTKVKTTADNIATGDIATMTEFAHIAQTSLISTITKEANNTLKVLATIENADLSVGYDVKAIGIYAKPRDTAQEVLYAVALEESGKYNMPAYNGLKVNALSLTLYIKLDTTENISITVDPAAYITERDVKAKVDDVIGKLAKDLRASKVKFNPDGTITTENSIETVLTTFNADDSITEKHVFKDSGHTTVTLKTTFTDDEVITVVV